MIKPAISPRTITASATTGLISAAKSGVKNIKDIKSSFKFGLEAIGVGSYFVFYGKLKAVLISYPTNEIKEFINE